MLISNMEFEKLSQDQITKLIYDGINDDGRQGDCIFVFGSAALIRVEKATQLFKLSRAPLIVISGGTSYGRRTPEEALVMKNHAVSLGVPEKSIIIERESNNTKENVINSLEILEKCIGLKEVDRLLIVSAPWHIRRCLLTLQTYMPSWIKYTTCPDDRIMGRKENWAKHITSKQIVLNEAESLIKYVKKKDIMDYDIELN